jgi:hypothetical protein
MSRRLRFVASLMVLACCAWPAWAMQGAALERGTAITDPLALRELDSGRFGLARILLAERSVDTPITGGQLFALRPILPVRKAIDAEFDRYIAKHKADHPEISIGVGDGNDFQLFDRAPLYSDDTRFVLSGIVNRMDRAYVAPNACGEIRLIYRLIPTNVPQASDSLASPRLPMTLNVVLRAKGDHTIGPDGHAITCAGIAGKWLSAGASPLRGPALAEKLVAPDGPLAQVVPDNIDRIETNIQIVHALKSPTRDFRTDYLLKVFDYNARSKAFEESPLENQIDRARILADETLKRAFKAWLLDPKHVIEFDRGTILIPPDFLATGALAATPVGFSSSSLQPEFGLTQGDDPTIDPVFTSDDVVRALEKAAEQGGPLQNIRSVAGFERRLNDITCSGCHQTRGIGGFHFPGVDWLAPHPSNATIVPASPHFFGDQARRRDILMALRDGRTPDYSRGFSSRPQLRGGTELAGTEYGDGWGAHCYAWQPGAADNDRSFRLWGCAEGLACQVMDKASRMGMCFVKNR